MAFVPGTPRSDALRQFSGFLVYPDAKESHEAQSQEAHILIAVDDVGYSDCGAFGREIPTPNLIKLGKEGIRFRHFIRGRSVPRLDHYF